MKSVSTRNLTLSALFAALTAVFSQIAFNIGPIPINLAVLSVFLAGGLLGAKYGAVSQLVYVLLGFIGAPVFANFTGGASIVVGPTGGYIVAYIVMALIVGIVSDKMKTKQIVFLPIAMLGALLICYTMGTAWFMHNTNTGLQQSLVWCVYPFIIGDLIKIAVATMLTLRLKKAIKF